MTSINPMFSVQKYDGLEEMIPMMYHTTQEYVNSKVLKTFAVGGLV